MEVWLFLPESLLGVEEWPCCFSSEHRPRFGVESAIYISALSATHRDSVGQVRRLGVVPQRELPPQREFMSGLLHPNGARNVRVPRFMFGISTSMNLPSSLRRETAARTRGSDIPLMIMVRTSTRLFWVCLTGGVRRPSWSVMNASTRSSSVVACSCRASALRSSCVVSRPYHPRTMRTPSHCAARSRSALACRTARR